MHTIIKCLSTHRRKADHFFILCLQSTICCSVALENIPVSSNLQIPIHHQMTFLIIIVPVCTFLTELRFITSSTSIQIIPVTIKLYPCIQDQMPPIIIIIISGIFLSPVRIQHFSIFLEIIPVTIYLASHVGQAGSLLIIIICSVFTDGPACINCTASCKFIMLSIDIQFTICHQISIFIIIILRIVLLTELSRISSSASIDIIPVTVQLNSTVRY